MRKQSLISFLIVTILIAVGVFLVDFSDDEISPVEVDTSDWETFTSPQYDFSISYPASDMNRALAPDDPIAPKFNFYIKPQGVPVNTPFDHFSNVTNVSVFPNGIPTEGLIGQTSDLPENWDDKFSENSIVYLLENGTPFAAYLSFNESPESWEDWGFVWVRLRGDNFEGVCFEDGQEMGPEEQCDPLGNESITIRHRGEVNEDMWPVLKAIAESVEFTNQ